MIRVTIDVLPQGDEKRARRVGVAEIWNDETGSLRLGNYIARVFSVRDNKERDIWREGELKGFPRPVDPWLLLRAVLNLLRRGHDDK